MVDFIPPESTKIPFKFDSSGYTPPDFTSVDFKFSPTLVKVALNNAINGVAVYQQPKDYLKSCNTNVVGYTSGSLQIFKSDCIYGGIRDLSVILRSINFTDIPAYIKIGTTDYIDLDLSLKGWSKEVISNITGALKGWIVEQSKDLPWYIKQGLTGQVDLVKHLKVFQHQQAYFTEIIKGWSTGVTKDLFNTVKSWQSDIIDISEYIKTTIQETSDLNTIVYKIWQHSNRDINLMLHGWQAADLQSIIQAWHTENLNGILRATYFSDVGAFLYAIQPVDIEAEVMGWAIQDLQIYIAKGQYDGDLSADIYGITSINLPFHLVGKLGIQTIKDLKGTMTNFAVEDLPVYLNTISYSDLNAYLLSSRLTADLRFEIYPKIVFVRHNINVSFLEHRDLVASINHTCVSSGFKELQFSLLAKHKYDLPCRIYGGDGSNIVDLKVLINSYEYISQNTIPVMYINLEPVTRANIYYKQSIIYSMDTINVYSSTLNKSYNDLTYSVVGDMLHEDLSASIHPYSNKHYGSSVTQKFVTLKLKNNIEDFRKYVELTFNSYANQYYYFSGNQRAYKAFRDDHWVVRVEGHQLLPIGAGFEKTKVMRKYIFNLRHYDTIDAAIIDMIDRVTLLRNSDLEVAITSIGGVYKDLNVCVMPSDINGISARRKYYTNRTLSGSILVTRPQDADLFAYITPTGLEAESNLTSEITGIDYENPTDGIVDFNFEGSGDIQPPSDQIDFTFIFGDN